MPLEPSPKVTLTARTAVEGGEGQGLAGEAAGRRGATRGEVGARSGVAGEAERRERVAGADDRQIGGGAGRDLQRAARLDRGVVWPAAVATVAAPLALRCGLDAGGKIDRLQHVGDRRRLQVDRRVAVAVGDDVAADAGAGRDRRRAGRRGVLERDGLAVDVQRGAVLDQVAEGSCSWSCAPRRPWRRRRRPKPSASAHARGSALPVMAGRHRSSSLSARAPRRRWWRRLAGIQGQSAGDVALHAAGDVDGVRQDRHRRRAGVRGCRDRRSSCRRRRLRRCRW